VSRQTKRYPLTLEQERIAITHKTKEAMTTAALRVVLRAALIAVAASGVRVAARAAARAGTAAAAAKPQRHQQHQQAQRHQQP